jgi:hypothetical protein
LAEQLSTYSFLDSTARELLENLGEAGRRELEKWEEAGANRWRRKSQKSGPSRSTTLVSGI